MCVFSDWLLIHHYRPVEIVNVFLSIEVWSTSQWSGFLNEIGLSSFLSEEKCQFRVALTLNGFLGLAVPSGCLQAAASKKPGSFWWLFWRISTDQVYCHPWQCILFSVLWYIYHTFHQHLLYCFQILLNLLLSISLCLFKYNILLVYMVFN